MKKKDYLEADELMFYVEDSLMLAKRHAERFGEDVEKLRNKIKDNPLSYAEEVAWEDLKIRVEELDIMREQLSALCVYLIGRIDRRDKGLID